MMTAEACTGAIPVDNIVGVSSAAAHTLAAGIIFAVASMHAAGLVHLDLHLKNIFLHVCEQNECCCRLGDFGTTRLFRKRRALERPPSGYCMGLHGSAPRQLRDDPSNNNNQLFNQL